MLTDVATPGSAVRPTRAVAQRVVRRPAWVAPSLVALALVTLAVKAPAFVMPMGQDQGLYHAVAEEILRGGVPYRDAWDPKPPGIFYTHALVLAVLPDPWRECHLGSLPGLSRSDLQPRCGTLLFESVDAVFTLILAAVVGLLARRLGFSWPGVVIAAGLTAICASLALIDGEGSTPEKYALLPSTGVVLAGLAFVRSEQRRWLVCAGLCAGIAALFKPTNMASIAALSVFLLLQRRRSSVLASVSSVLAYLWIPLVALLAASWVLFAAMGAGAQLVEATVQYNLARFGFQGGRIPWAAAAAAWSMFRDGLALPWLLASLGAALAWRWRWARLLPLWAVFDVLALFLGGAKFTRVYFMQLVPSGSLLASLALCHLWRASGRAPSLRSWLVLSMVAIIALSQSFQVRVALGAWNNNVAFGWTTNSVERIASMLRNLPADETIFVWGDEAQLYTLAGRRPPTRFLNLVGLAANGDSGARARRAELFGTLQLTPPAVIVVDQRMADDDPSGQLGLNPHATPELQQLLSERYMPMDSSILRSYPGSGRERVYVRSAELCQMMPGCRLEQG
jgi:hypothetical protein